MEAITYLLTSPGVIIILADDEAEVADQPGLFCVKLLEELPHCL